MTPEEFRQASIALLRTSVGWQSGVARHLNIDSRTVRRWLADGDVPGWVDGRMRELMGGTSAAAWPRDEWVIGDGVSSDGHRREYIVHTVTPMFIARIVECDPLSGLPEPDEEPVDVLSETVFSFDDTVLCEFAWLDQPNPGEITQLLEAAADAIDRQNDADSER